MQSRINALFFDRKTFTRASAADWARKHGFIDFDGIETLKRKLVINIGPMKDEHEYRVMVLDAGVHARIEIVGGGMPMVAKLAEGTENGGANIKFYVGPQGQGGAATHNVRPLPDFNDIYNSRADTNAQREQQQAAVRRDQNGRLNAKKFGIHGASAPEPVLAYEPEHYPLVQRGSNGLREDGNPNETPQPRAMRFIVGKKGPSTAHQSPSKEGGGLAKPVHFKPTNAAPPAPPPQKQSASQTSAKPKTRKPSAPGMLMPRGKR